MSNKDNFCSNCGQVNDLKPLSIKQYLTEFLSGFFSFDTRTLNTISPLLFKPGKVTNEYVHGERMKYVNPFQMYLHTSIVFFLITGIFNTIDGYKDVSKFNKTLSKEDVQRQKDSISNALEKNNIDIGFLKVNFNDKNSKNDSKKKIKTKISNHDIKLLIASQIDSLLISEKFLNISTNDSLKENRRTGKLNNLILSKIASVYSKIRDKHTYENKQFKGFETFKKVYLDTLESKLITHHINFKINKSLRMNTDDLVLKDLFGESFFNKISAFKNSNTKHPGKALDSLGYPITTWNVFLYKKAQDIDKFKHDKEFKKAYLRNMISKTSLVLFFMLPIFTLFLKLLYIRRKVNYTEHLIFTFHLQTTFFILLLITIIIERIFDFNYAILIAAIMFAVYIFIAMKKFYKQGFFKTLIKYFLLNLAYLILSIFGFIIVAFLAFIM
jgi:hypothetical protein